MKKIPHHKLIYGATVEEIEKNHLIVPLTIEPFQKYTLPMYGAPDGGDDEFIGFEYGRIYGLYDNLHYAYDGSLKLTNCSVPSSIKELFNITYPLVIGKCYAIIQDVYTSHYANGNIAYGYWIFTDNDETCDKLSDMSYNESTGDINVLCPGHNMKNIPSQYFYGKIIKRLPENECSDDCEKLAKQLCKSYTSINIPSRDNMLEELHQIDPNIKLSTIPIIVLLEGMCYCCT